MAIVNNATMNIAVHVSFCTSVLNFGYIPRSGIAGSNLKIHVETEQVLEGRGVSDGNWSGE